MAMRQLPPATGSCSGVGRDPLIGRRIAHDVDRVEALLDALQLLAQKPPQHDDAGIGMRQIFERVDRDRALACLRFANTAGFRKRASSCSI